MASERAGKKIMVAMSGGVDSSVTAALLMKKGFEVSGVFMLLAQPDGAEQAERAGRIADFLRIPLEVVDIRDDFERLVLDYFSSSYLAGKTPNPCVVCNHTIKFGKLLEHALAKGMDLMATGHYVRTAKGPDGIVQLLRGNDPKKDQSYFLSRLTQEQLARVCFPLGESRKEEVYEIAAELGLSGMHGSESQDICFMAGRSLKDFFAVRTQALPRGEFVTVGGEKKGEHDGVQNYTVGQRRGLGIPDATPYYVVGLDAARNQVIIGKDEDLWRDELLVKDMNFISGLAPTFPAKFLVKIRYRHLPAEALVECDKDGLRIKFSEAQRAITPGQFAVLYDDDQLIGGGEIV